MRAFVTALLALGLAVSPAMAGDDTKKDAGDKAKDTPAKTDKDSNSNKTATPDANPAVEAEIQQMRDLLKAQSDQLEQQRAALENEARKVQALEERLRTNPSISTVAAAPAAVVSSAPSGASTPTVNPELKPVVVSDKVPSNASAIPQANSGGDMSEKSPLSFKIGAMDFTPGGFLDATYVFRTTNVGSGIGTSFGAIPFNNSLPTGGLTESRLSAQNSRVSLKASGGWGDTTVTGYVEGDFLGYTPPNVYQTSNSDTFRLRLYFADIKHGAFEFQGGQMWSFMTPGRNGLSPMPSDIFYSQDMDTNYQVGLTWARQDAFRFIVHPTNWWALGVSFENPEQYAPTTVVYPSSIFTSQFNSGSGNTSSAAAVANTSVPNLMPDIIVKTTFDGHWGEKHEHFEVAGLYREFKVFNNIESTPGTTNSIAGGGVSANLNLELVKGLHAIVNSFWSDGGGRYIFGLGPDAIVKPNGYLSGVHSGSGIGGFEYQMTHSAMVYGYYGGAYYGRNYGYLPSTATPAPSCNGLAGYTCVGFGFPGSSSSSNRAIQEGTIGFIPTLWQSHNYGKLQMITQYSYLTRAPWYISTTATGANPRDAHDSLVYIDLRYTLP